MADNYTACTPEQALRTTKAEADELTKLLEAQENKDGNYHGFQSEYVDGKFYMFAEDFMDVNELPDKFLKALGKIIKQNNIHYLEFGYAYTCSKMRPGEFGGGSFRVMRDGTIKYPNIKWED